MLRSYRPKNKSFIIGGFSRRVGKSPTVIQPSPQIPAGPPVIPGLENLIPDNLRGPSIRKTIGEYIGNFAGSVNEKVTPLLLEAVINRILAALSGVPVKKNEVLPVPPVPPVSGRPVPPVPDNKKSIKGPKLPPKVKERIIKGGALDIAKVASQLGYKPNPALIAKCLLKHKGDFQKTRNWILETM